MKFLCDVHISFKVKSHIQKLGFEAIHVNEILEGSRTKDTDLSKYCDSNGCILITKDADFKNSFLLFSKPKKLIKVNLGNLDTTELCSKMDQVVSILHRNSHLVFLIEIGPQSISITTKE
jgi:predicted nuclease of predicted toxin-antitoxin system